MALIGTFQANYTLGMTLAGTDGDDTIYGYGGDDTIYGSGGIDVIYGGAGTDFIYAGSQWNPTANAYWGWDYVEGGAGNDFIVWSGSISDNNLLYGDSWTASSDDGVDTVMGGIGTDTIYGGGAGDTLFGGFGNDTIYGDYSSNFTNDGADWIYGEEGNDHIYGGGGTDHIYGGANNDWISGGAGKDYLSGGSGTDKFAFFKGETTADANRDVITDWNVAYDYIDAAKAGTSSNYVEKTIAFGAGFNSALSAANSSLQWVGTDYAFITDGQNAWLFGDLDGNGKAETAIELQGVTSVSQMNWSDII